MARPSLQNNVKFKALVRRLSLPRPYVRGLLDTMWDVANESGNPVLGAPDDVEAAAEWPGTTGELFSALLDLRLVDELPDGRWVIHDYWDHAPKYVKNRVSLEAKRKGSFRPKNDWKLDNGKTKDLRQFCVPTRDTCVQDGPQKDTKLAQVVLLGEPKPPSPFPPPYTPSIPPPPEVPNGTSSPTGDMVAPDADSAQALPGSSGGVLHAGKANAAKVRKGRGGNEPKPEHAELRTYFCERWKAKHGADYAWKHGRDDAHAKWVLDNCDRNAGNAKAIIEAFLSDDDPWLSGKGDEISLAVSRFNRYRAKPQAMSDGSVFLRADVSDAEINAVLSEVQREQFGSR
jgi:hypothetical protein